MFQSAKVTFKVIQGHGQWCYSIGHIRFPLYVSILQSCTVTEIVSLISQNLKRSRDFEHIPLGVIYHACTCTTLYQSVHKMWSD